MSMDRRQAAGGVVRDRSGSVSGIIEEDDRDRVSANVEGCIGGFMVAGISSAADRAAGSDRSRPDRVGFRSSLDVDWRHPGEFRVCDFDLPRSRFGRSNRRSDHQRAPNDQAPFRFEKRSAFSRLLVRMAGGSRDGSGVTPVRVSGRRRPISTSGVQRARSASPPAPLEASC